MRLICSLPRMAACLQLWQIILDQAESQHASRRARRAVLPCRRCRPTPCPGPSLLQVNMFDYFTKAMGAEVEEPMRWVQQQDQWVRGRCAYGAGQPGSEGGEGRFWQARRLGLRCHKVAGGCPRGAASCACVPCCLLLCT